MSNISDLVGAITGEDDDAISSAWTIVGGILGTMADVGGAIGLVQLAVGIVQDILDQDNSTAQILSALSQDFQSLQQQIAIDDKIARMASLDLIMAPAWGAFQNLTTIMTDYPQPVPEDVFLNAMQPCLAAIGFFTQSDYPWLANWGEMNLAYYNDQWSGAVAPPANPDGTVFSYTYSLPQFLRAIYMTLTTIGALNPNAGDTYQATFQACVQTLTTVHDTIAQAIVGTKMPAILTSPGQAGFQGVVAWSDDLGTVSGSQDDSGNAIDCQVGLNWANWEGSAFNANTIWPYGAIELFSGSNIVESYQDRYFGYQMDASGGTTPAFPPVGWMSTENLTNIVTLLGLRVSQRKKELYVTIGLRAVSQTIGQLSTLAAVPGPQGAPYTDWTLDEIYADLALGSPPDPPADILGPITSLLQWTPPCVPTPALAPDDPNAQSLGPQTCDQLIPAFPVPPGLGFVIADLPDGTFLEVNETGDVYVMAGGAPIYISPSAWAVWPSSPQPVAVPEARVLSMWWVAFDGTYLTGLQTGNLYDVSFGAPVLVPADPAQASIVVDQTAIDNAGQPGVWSHLNAPTSCYILAATGVRASDENPRFAQLSQVVEWTYIGKHLLHAVYRDYYRLSPPIAAELRADPGKCEAVTALAIRPLLAWYSLAAALVLAPDQLAAATTELAETLSRARESFSPSVMAKAVSSVRDTGASGVGYAFCSLLRSAPSGDTGPLSIRLVGHLGASVPDVGLGRVARRPRFANAGVVSCRTLGAASCPTCRRP